MRSSGMCAAPAWRMRRGLKPFTTRPRMATVPDVAGKRPVRMRTSSVWPLPSTPARPTISPARTSKDTPLRTRRFSSLTKVEVAHGQQGRPRGARRGQALGADLPADHQVGDVLLGQLGGLRGC